MQSFKRAINSAANARSEFEATSNKNVSINWKRTSENTRKNYLPLILRAIQLNDKLRDKELKIKVKGEPHMQPIDHAKGKPNVDPEWHLTGEIHDSKDRHLVGVHVKLASPDEPKFGNKQYQLKSEVVDQKK